MPHLKEGQVALQVVFARADKERIQQAAQAAGMSTATWVRVQVLAALPPSRTKRPAAK